MGKNIRSFFCALISALLLIHGMEPAPVIYAQAGEWEGELHAQGAVLMDGGSGRVLYGKNENVPMAMASTTKIMTCILILEQAKPEEMVEVSAYAASMPKVKLGMKKGETYVLRDLLYSMMLESHNDAAVALAEHMGRKLDEESLRGEDGERNSPSRCTPEESRRAVGRFCEQMNQKAASLGCKDTCFLTPGGLDATEENNGIKREHSTTPAELARIMSYCILESPAKQEFLEITGTPSYQFTAGGRTIVCVNHNAFLGQMEGAISGKTGFTNKAGYCYVGALTREGKTFVVALLACGWPNHRNDKWEDTRKLMEYGLASYDYADLEEAAGKCKKALLGRLPVEEGRPENFGETAYVEYEVAEEYCLPVLIRQDEKIRARCSIPEKLTAPVREGERVGQIEYLVDGVCYRREGIFAGSDMEKTDFGWCLFEVIKRFLYF